MKKPKNYEISDWIIEIINKECTQAKGKANLVGAAVLYFANLEPSEKAKAVTEYFAEDVKRGYVMPQKINLGSAVANLKSLDNALNERLAKRKGLKRNRD